MPAPRRLLVLLASGALALATAGPAAAQSAGDEQYSDPLEQSGGGGTGSTPSLSPTPQSSGGGSSSGSGSSGSGSSGSGSASSGSSSSGAGTAATGTATQGATAAAGTASELPRTGADTGTVLLLGLALLLLGIGLRLRTADARP